jgi:crotonobetainyl-CoA:carnitine CoA-transferase CaiB-like acyl-CoA transferase
MTDALDDRPYAELLVLDMSQGMAGPYCGVLLGQYGANVIKIEPPQGDWIRVMGGGKPGMTPLTIVNNLGKRSICIDAAQSGGRELILKMAERADVFIENNRPGVMTKLGLDFDTVHKSNPGLVYLSITGFGDTGPYAHKPGTDSVVQAMTGMAVANQDAAEQPRRIGILVPDIITAMYATQSIGAALFARDKRRGGVGRHIRISLAECCVALQAGHIVDDFLFAGQDKPPITVPSGVFATRDGHIVLVTLRDAMWEGLCRALGREDWLAEPRYASRALRAVCADEINHEVASILRSRSTQEWEALFEKHDVLCAKVQNYAQLRDDPQIRHMGYFGETDQPPYGKLPIPNIPGTERTGVLPAAPHSGQHSRDILAEFGYGTEEVAAFERAGLIRQAS